MNMDLGKLGKMMRDREAWHIAVHGVKRVWHDWATERQQQNKIKTDNKNRIHPEFQHSTFNLSHQYFRLLHACCWWYALASWPHPCSASFAVPFSFQNNWDLFITLAPNNTQASHFKPFHLVKNLTHYHHSKLLLKSKSFNLSTPLTDLYESISLLLLY